MAGIRRYIELEDTDDQTRWYAINTNPRYEDIVSHILRNESFEVFLPKISKKSNKELLEPLFSGYLFVRFNTSLSNWSRIKYCHGVRRILCIGDKPIPIPKELIALIEKRMNINSNVNTVLPFNSGEKVRFDNGVFAGLEGIFTGETSGRERVKILLNCIYNGAIVVEVKASELSEVN